MGCGAAEATGLGFALVCCQPTELFHTFSQFTPPPLPTSLSLIIGIALVLLPITIMRHTLSLPFPFDTNFPILLRSAFHEAWKPAASMFSKAVDSFKKTPTAWGGGG